MVDVVLMDLRGFPLSIPVQAMSCRRLPDVFCLASCATDHQTDERMLPAVARCLKASTSRLTPQNLPAVFSAGFEVDQVSGGVER